MLPLHHGSRFFHFNRRYRAFCSAGAIGVSTNRRGCFQRIRHVPKQPLNFAKILTRGGRGLLGFAPRDRSPPWGHTPGGAAGGRRYTPGRAGRLPGAAGTSRAGSAAPGGGYTPGRRRGPGQRVHPGQAGSPGGDPATAPGSAPSGLCVDGGHGRPTVALAARAGKHSGAGGAAATGPNVARTRAAPAGGSPGGPRRRARRTPAPRAQDGRPRAARAFPAAAVCSGGTGPARRAPACIQLGAEKLHTWRQISAGQ